MGNGREFGLTDLIHLEDVKQIIEKWPATSKMAAEKLKVCSIKTSAL